MPNPATSSGFNDNHKRGVVAVFFMGEIHTGSPFDDANRHLAQKTRD